MSTLNKPAAERKTYPIATGFLDYFPDAVAEVAHVSYVGNEQHHPGQPLHWDRAKSTDESDALIRHFMQRGTRDADGQRHTAKVAWRALALLQKEIETEIGLTAPPAWHPHVPDSNWLADLPSRLNSSRGERTEPTLPTLREHPFDDTL